MNITKGYTFTDGLSNDLNAANLHALIESATITNIDNSNISSSAAIIASKLNLSTINQTMNCSSGTFYLDHSNTRVGIGTTSPSEDLHVVTDTVLVEYADDGAFVGPEFDLYRNSSTAADNDILGQVAFSGMNDATTPVKRNYARIWGTIDDKSANAEDGELHLGVIVDGAESDFCRIGDAGMEIFHDGNPNGFAWAIRLMYNDTQPLWQLGANGNINRYTSGGTTQYQLLDNGTGASLKIYDGGSLAIDINSSRGIGIGGVASITSPLNIQGMPTSSAGLSTGDFWNNSGAVNIV